MSWFSKILGKPETRAHAEVSDEKNTSEASSSDGFWGFLTSLGYGGKIGKDQALTLSAFYNGVNIISDDIAKLPIHLFKKEEKGRTKVQDHPLLKVFTKPNQQQTFFFLIKTLILRAIIQGNGFAKIIRNGRGEVINLEIITKEVTPVISNGRVFYKVQDREKAYSYEDILHIKHYTFDGITGVSVLRYAAQSMGITLSAQTYGKGFFDNGSNPTGVIETDKALNKPGAKEKLKKGWDLLYSGKGPKGVAVLDEGAKYKRISITPEEAQFLATRKDGVTDVARWLNIPPHKLKDLDRATFNNIEEQNIDYIGSCIQSWITIVEQEFNAKLLLDTEIENGLYTKFNINALLRANVKSRAEYYRIMWNIGAMSPNDVRSYEEMNPRDGGDEYFTPASMVTSNQLEEKSDEK